MIVSNYSFVFDREKTTFGCSDIIVLIIYEGFILKVFLSVTYTFLMVIFIKCINPTYIVKIFSSIEAYL